MALGSTLGAFIALGVVVFFVLLAKWQHRCQRLKTMQRLTDSQWSLDECPTAAAVNPYTGRVITSGGGGVQCRCHMAAVGGAWYAADVTDETVQTDLRDYDNNDDFIIGSSSSSNNDKYAVTTTLGTANKSNINDNYNNNNDDNYNNDTRATLVIQNYGNDSGFAAAIGSRCVVVPTLKFTFASSTDLMHHDPTGSLDPTHVRTPTGAVVDPTQFRTTADLGHLCRPQFVPTMQIGAPTISDPTRIGAPAAAASTPRCCSSYPEHLDLTNLVEWNSYDAVGYPSQLQLPYGRGGDTAVRSSPPGTNNAFALRQNLSNVW